MPLTRRHVLKSGVSAMAANLALPAAASAGELSKAPELPGVEFMMPDDPRYDGSFAAYNAAYHKVPRLRALCMSSEGLSNAVKWASDTGTPFAIRSTGHDFAGHSQHDTLVIDTSPLNRIAMSDDGSEVTVGAGARNGAISMALAEKGRILGGGTFESVGAAGITLGGGIGHFSRLTGLLCDQLLAVELVGPTGQLLTVDAASHPNLFWALRGGGGGSFGIVSQMRFRTTPAPILTRFDAPIRVGAVEGAHILHRWQYWLRELPRTMTAHIAVMRDLGGNVMLILKGQSLENHATTKAHIQTLFGPKNPVQDQWIIDAPVREIMHRLYGVPHHVSALHHVSRSHIVAEPVPVSGIAGMLHALVSQPPNALIVNFEGMGGATADVPSDATAFPHRSALAVIHYQKPAYDPADLVAPRKALEDATMAMRPHVTDGVYVNYPEPDLQNWAVAYWGDNLPRLSAIKRAFDPQNLFRHAQSVPLR